MRCYDDPVEVRRGMVNGPGGTQEGPEQFLWRGRLWKVCDVVAHWVETGPWWQSPGVHAVLGSDAVDDRGDDRADDPSSGPAGSRVGTDLLAEREVWRVEAARGLAAAKSRPGAGPGAGQGSGSRPGAGVFDLVFDWADGSWQLARCED